MKNGKGFGVNHRPSDNPANLLPEAEVFLIRIDKAPRTYWLILNTQGYIQPDRIEMFIN